VSAWNWFGGATEPWRKLIDEKSVEAIDDDSGEILDVPTHQVDGSHVEGLLVRFLYTDATGRERRRLVACKDCWQSSGRVYVYGYCHLADAMRTFRTDRMSELEEVRSNKAITDPQSYFDRYAVDRAPTRGQLPPDRAVGARAVTPEATDIATRKAEFRAREACIAGLRVLAHIGLADEVSVESERNVVISFIESRLAMAGFDHDARVVQACAEFAEGLAVPSRSFVIAVNAIAKDEQYYRLALSCAQTLADVDGSSDPHATEALAKLSAAGAAKGWAFSADGP
jgi:WYL domain